MKKKRFTEPQIAFVLKEAEAGLSVTNILYPAQPTPEGTARPLGSRRTESFQP